MNTKDYASWCYLLRCGDSYKIGRAKSVPDRVRQLQTGSPVQISLVHAVYGDGYLMESWLHDIYKEYRIIGEWFRLPTNEVKWIIERMDLEPWPIPLEYVEDTGEDEAWIITMGPDYVITKRLRTQ